MPLREVRSARQAIDVLGGVVRVATLCGVGRNAVSNWFRRGIPPEAYHVLAPRLRRAGFEYPPSLFKQYGRKRVAKKKLTPRNGGQ
jgi:hypothetical protein